MGLWNWLRLPADPVPEDGMMPVAVTVSVPITSEEVRAVGKEFEFRHAWRCGCGATLKIRARENRSTGASNFMPWPAGHPYAGHSQLPSSALTWAGLAEERGWKVDPVECPACQRNLSRAQYKALKVSGQR